MNESQNTKYGNPSRVSLSANWYYYRALLKAGKFERDHWLDFCMDPVRDFIMPDVRPFEERMMLEATIKDYVAYFKNPHLETFAA